MERWVRAVPSLSRVFCVVFGGGEGVPAVAGLRGGGFGVLVVWLRPVRLFGVLWAIFFSRFGLVFGCFALSLGFGGIFLEFLRLAFTRLLLCGLTRSLAVRFSLYANSLGVTPSSS